VLSLTKSDLLYFKMLLKAINIRLTLLITLQTGDNYDVTLNFKVDEPTSISGL